MPVSFPFHLHRRGVGGDEAFAIRDMIEQVLFTAPGERVNRPDFGCGLQQMTFGGLGGPMQAALQSTVAGALQRWLGDLIQVEAVQVISRDDDVQVIVRYVDRHTRIRQETHFER